MLLDRGVLEILKINMLLTGYHLKVPHYNFETVHFDWHRSH